MWKDLLGLLVVPQCMACGQALSRQEEITCTRCLTQLPQTDFHLSPQDNELYRRLAGRVPIHGAASLFFFDKKGRFQKLIQQLKYRHKPQVGSYLGRLYGHVLMDHSFLQSVEALVPVPLHPRKQRKRGYNQAEKIAQGFAQVTGIPVKNGLRRKKDTHSQTQKRGGDRWANVAEAFVCQEPLPSHILLVDDVVTTGATLEACVRACLAADTPPQKISLISIGMARDA
ncbi:MAG: ComF family protein [Bacteroidota bacterium]